MEIEVMVCGVVFGTIVWIHCFRVFLCHIHSTTSKVESGIGIKTVTRIGQIPVVRPNKLGCCPFFSKAESIFLTDLVCFQMPEVLQLDPTLALANLPTR
jgi:hypothetical protein